MIILIAGASHTGKTHLAQKLLEQYHYPYLSIDHLKMGLIRSGNTNMTVFDDDALTEYLWPILCEMIKTAIENNQNLIVEGWLIMTQSYIEHHFDEIRSFACVIEQRIDDSYCTKQWLVEENKKTYENCRHFGCNHILIDENYEIGDLSCLM